MGWQNLEKHTVYPTIYGHAGIVTDEIRLTWCETVIINNTDDE